MYTYIYIYIYVVDVLCCVYMLWVVAAVRLLLSPWRGIGVFVFLSAITDVNKHAVDIE